LIIDAQDFLPVLDGLLGQRHQPAADAGIGPDRIETAIFRDRLVDEGLHVGFGTGIRHHGLDRAAGIADEFGGFLHALGAVDDDELRALPGEQHRRGAPDTAASTCNDDGFAFKAAHEFLPDRYARRRLPPCGIQTRFQTSKSLETMRALTYSDSEQY
jgi:hypothetical protein